MASPRYIHEYNSNSSSSGGSSSSGSSSSSNCHSHSHSHCIGSSSSHRIGSIPLACEEESRERRSAALEAVHVLAVDDSFVDRKVIEKLLKHSSYRVTTVDSGRRALEILGLAGEDSLHEEDEINLIITDYCMPGMSGYDLLKAIKESSALKEIPVVVMSSENVPHRINRCLAEGAEEFLLKPVKLADVKRLRGHVRHQQQSTSDCVDNEPIVHLPKPDARRGSRITRAFFS